MPVPPSYADLGKSARDLFSKGFNYGFYKLEAKTKSESGIELKTNTTSNHDSGKFLGTLETKMIWKDYGISLKEKWNTDNCLSAELSIEDKILEGLKLSFDTSFNISAKKKNGNIKTEYKHEYIHTNCDLDFDFAGPIINAAFVIGLNGWVGGYQMVYDTAKSKLSQSNFALGYLNKEFALNLSLTDYSDFHGSLYRRINEKVELGGQVHWAAGVNCTRFAVATRYAAADDSCFRARINNMGQIGLSYQQQIFKGLTLTLSTLLEGRSFDEGGHKVGAGLEFEA